MKRITKNDYNSIIMKPDGGLVSCKECGLITGFIYERQHQYINYMFMCKCKNFGRAEIYRGRKPLLEHPKRQLYQKGNIHICQNCERPLFWVKEDAIDNYAFNVICQCGVEYDSKFENRRENED